MSLCVSPSDPRLSWQGAVSLQKTDEWVMPWRINYADHQILDEGLLARASMPSGVRLSFYSDTTSISGKYTAFPDLEPLDVCCDGQLRQTVPLANREEFSITGLPKGEKLVELWLPPYGDFHLTSLALDNKASLGAYEDKRPRWIAYGSSITHCCGSASPIYTWPAITARNKGWHLTNLGYGGQCHLDPMVARMIRDMPADYLSMSVGINIMGANSLNLRTFGPGIMGFVQLVREKHPQTPFVVISPIYATDWDNTPNAVGFTLCLMRQEVEKAIAALQAHGDKHLYYVNGLDILGPADKAYLGPDLLHPSPDGYKMMGQRFTDLVANRYFC